MSGVAELLQELGRHTPQFPDAACRHPDNRAIFDAGEHSSWTAKKICGTCPALQRCTDWYNQLPEKHRPVQMVVAGQFREPHCWSIDRGDRLHELHAWALERGGPVTAREVAQFLHVTPNNAGNHLRKAAEHGFFERGDFIPDPNGGRRPVATFIPVEGA